MCVFFKQCFLTRLHIWFNLIIKHMHFIKIKSIGVYINFVFITQSLIEVTVLWAMLFKNFDKFSSVLHFSTLKLLLFSCQKSLRFFSAHILKLCVFSQKCAWKTQNADQKLSLRASIIWLHEKNLLVCDTHITIKKAQKGEVIWEIVNRCILGVSVYQHIWLKMFWILGHCSNFLTGRISFHYYRKMYVFFSIFFSIPTLLIPLSSSEVPTEGWPWHLRADGIEVRWLSSASPAQPQVLVNLLYSLLCFESSYVKFKKKGLRCLNCQMYTAVNLNYLYSH